MISSEFLSFNFYQNMLSITILIFGYFLVFIFGTNKKSDLKVVSILYIWHTLFSIIYYLYSLSNPADAKGYYLKSLLIDGFEYKLGTKLVTQITSIFSQGLSASYLNTTLIFNIFGSIGLILFYLSSKKYFTNVNKLWVFIFFIPSMSFWSAGLGKDAISFFSVCLFLYALTVARHASTLLIIAFLTMFLIRPHVALMILVSYTIYFIIKAKMHLLFKVIILPVIILVLFFSLGLVQEYVGLEEISLGSVSGYVDSRQGYNQSGGSSLDIASMSYPMQIFTYIFRPLPFEANSAVALITSMENLILLLLFIYILFKSKFNLRPFMQGKNLWLFTYVLLTCTILAVTTANLGIATRQKWMFMPVLIYLLIYAFHNYKVTKAKVHQ